MRNRTSRASTSSREPRPSEDARVDPDALERRIAAAVRSWLDAFKAALLSRLDEAYALQLFEKYAGRHFPPPTRRIFTATPRPWMCRSSRPSRRSRHACIWTFIDREPRRKDKFFLKIFRNQDAIPISDLLPMLENMGLKVIAERPYELEFPGGRRAWIQDLELVMQARVGDPIRGAGA